MGKATWVKASGEWKEVKNVWENVGGTWKEKVVPKINITDNWKECIGYGKTIFGVHDNYSISAMTYDGKIIWTQTFPLTVSDIFINNNGDLCVISILNMYKLNKKTGEIISDISQRFSTYSSTIPQTKGVEVNSDDTFIISGCTKAGYMGMKKYTDEFGIVWTTEHSVSGFSNPYMCAVYSENYILAGTIKGAVYKYNKETGSYIAGSSIVISSISDYGFILGRGGYGGYALFASSSHGPATPYLIKESEDLVRVSWLATALFEYIFNDVARGRTFVGNTLREFLPDNTLSGSWAYDSTMQVGYDTASGYLVVVSYNSTNSETKISRYDSENNLVDQVNTDTYIAFGSPQTTFQNTLIIDN